MSSNSSEHRYTHISIDNYPTIKPIWYLKNEFDDKDLDNPSIEFGHKAQKALWNLTYGFPHTQDHDSYYRQLDLDEIPEAEDKLENYPSQRTLPTRK